MCTVLINGVFRKAKRNNLLFWYKVCRYRNEYGFHKSYLIQQVSNFRCQQPSQKHKRIQLILGTIAGEGRSSIPGRGSIEHGDGSRNHVWVQAGRDCIGSDIRYDHAWLQANISLSVAIRSQSFIPRKLTTAVSRRNIVRIHLRSTNLAFHSAGRSAATPYYKLRQVPQLVGQAAWFREIEEVA